MSGLSVSGFSVFINNVDIAGNNATLRIWDNTTSRIPNLILQRGDNIFGNDGFVDWKIENNGGTLNFVASITSTTSSSILTFFKMTRAVCTIENYLQTNYASTFTSSLNISGLTLINGSTTFYNNLNVSGLTLINGASTFQNTLAISGATTINNMIGGGRSCIK